MAKVRYVGTAAWVRSIRDDKGNPTSTVAVVPGEVVELTDQQSGHLANQSVPRHLRVFVLAGTHEDPQSEKFVPTRYDAVNTVGNASAFPEQDMGSTLPGGKSISNPSGTVIEPTIAQVESKPVAAPTKKEENK